ncbi:hypothetical protein PROPEN_04178 [Proteus penneri ATCC 35198]|nr:hypothetical protein PROPEN_04178 [Proteus penneri ATCC 35198]
MPTTARTIYRDSLNFYKNERRSIVTLSAILAVILAIIHALIGPNPQEYQVMIEFVANFKNTQLSSASPAELEAMSNSVVGIAKKCYHCMHLKHYSKASWFSPY